MLKIKNSKQFKKDLKRYQNQKKILVALNEVLSLLIAKKTLLEKHCDHTLSGNWSRHRECHIKPDVLLIYMVDEEFLYLERIGSHSELF